MTDISLYFIFLPIKFTFDLGQPTWRGIQKPN